MSKTRWAFSSAETSVAQSSRLLDNRHMGSGTRERVRVAPGPGLVGSTIAFYRRTASSASRSISLNSSSLYSSMTSSSCMLARTELTRKCMIALGTVSSRFLRTYRRVFSVTCSVCSRVFSATWLSVQQGVQCDVHSVEYRRAWRVRCGVLSGQGSACVEQAVAYDAKVGDEQRSDDVRLQLLARRRGHIGRAERVPWAGGGGGWVSLRGGRRRRRRRRRRWRRRRCACGCPRGGGAKEGVEKSLATGPGPCCIERVADGRGEARADRADRGGGGGRIGCRWWRVRRLVLQWRRCPPLRLRGAPVVLP